MNWCKFIDQTDDLSQKRDKVKEILSKMQECGRNCKNVGEMWENSAKCGKCGNVGGLYSMMLEIEENAKVLTILRPQNSTLKPGKQMNILIL